MNSLKYFLAVLGSVSLIFLGACGNSNQASNPDNSPTGSEPVESASSSVNDVKTKSAGHSDAPQKGGQVVESGSYHLEFLPEKEDKAVHLDLYLLKGDNHEAIPNAKVTAQVQMPDGTQKQLDFIYDAADKHYTAKLPEKAAGQYQVKVVADIKGEKVNGRFSFNQ